MLDNFQVHLKGISWGKKGGKLQFNSELSL